jgi:hypothetical protein
MPEQIGDGCVRYTRDEVHAMYEAGQVKAWHLGHEPGRPATVIRPLPKRGGFVDGSLEAKNARLREKRAARALECEP